MQNVVDVVAVDVTGRATGVQGLLALEANVLNMAKPFVRVAPSPQPAGPALIDDPANSAVVGSVCHRQPRHVIRDEFFQAVPGLPGHQDDHPHLQVWALIHGVPAQLIEAPGVKTPGVF